MIILTQQSPLLLAHLQMISEFVSVWRRSVQVWWETLLHLKNKTCRLLDECFLSTLRTLTGVLHVCVMFTSGASASSPVGSQGYCKHP